MSDPSGPASYPAELIGSDVIYISAFDVTNVGEIPRRSLGIAKYPVWS
jgi:hypothetical protein